MFKLRNLGLLLASLVTATAIAGAVTLIALDFAGTDGLARAWSTLTGWVFHSAPSAQPIGDWRASRRETAP